MSDRHDNLRPYVADMSAVERHILEAVERQLGDDSTKSFPEALQLLRRVEGALNRHVQALESHLKSFDGGSLAGTVKETVTGVLGVFAGLYDKVRKEQVSRMLRDDYTALNLAAISCTMLHTTALANREQATADLALRHLRDLAPLIMEINEVIPQVVVRELTEEGKAYDASLAQRAARDTQEAWRSSTPAHAGA